MINRGWFSVAGGFLIHLVLGTLYCWANITSSVTSRMRKYQPEVTYNDTLMVYAAALAAQGATMLLGGLIGQRIGTRYCVLLGGSILSIGIYLASYSESIGFLVFTEGVLFGIGVGICYTSPISCCVRWMPSRKGLVTGIIVGGFGCGAFIFGFLAIHLVNPNRVGVQTSGSNKNYYPPDSAVVANVPYMFQVLAVTYMMVVIVGSLLITDPTGEDLENIKKEEQFLQLPSSASDIDSTTHGEESTHGLSSTATHNILLRSKDESKYGSYRTVENNLEDGQTPRTTSDVASGGGSSSIELTHQRRDSDSSTSELLATSVVMDRNSSCNSNSSGKTSANVRKNSNPNLHAMLNQSQTEDTNTDTTSPDDSDTSTNHSSVEEVEVSPQDMIKNPIAWHIACCFITTTVGGMYLAGTFKTYGQATFHDEAYLSSISSISSVFNALGRIFWGHMADRFGAMRVLFGMSSIFSVIIGSYALSPLIGQWAFALWTWGIFFFEGGNFVLYVPIVVQQFGAKHSASNYGLIFSSYSLFVVVNITLLADSGWTFLTTTLLMGLLTFIGFVNLLLLDRHIKMSKKLIIPGRQSECKVT